MELRDAISKRRSVRRFDRSKNIEDSTIETILELALRAPSAGNQQPWKIYVVKDAQIRKDLGRSTIMSTFVATAPVVLVICVNLDRARRSYGIRGVDLYCLQDTAALIENILLLAVEEGLGSCWVGAFPETSCKKILSIPPKYRPVAIIPIGFSAEEENFTSRRALDEVTIWV